MERESVILTAEIEYLGEIHRASYYVEHGIVHTRIGGRIVPTPVAEDGAEATVTRLLMGHALKSRRRAQNAKAWTAQQPQQ